MSYRHLLVTIWIITLVFVTSWFVGFIAEQELLVELAAILPVFPVLGLLWLRPQEELAGWALFTIWLGLTYTSAGTGLELSAFGIVVALAIFGYFKSPWFLVVAWFGHIAWDFLPRELPPLFNDLPTACFIFDGIIGAYIVFRIKSGRWPSANVSESLA